MPDLGGAGRPVILDHRLDEIDAPARTVALIAQQDEGRARRRAESAMHALAQDIVAACGLGIGELGQGEVGLNARTPRVISRGQTDARNRRQRIDPRFRPSLQML